MFLYMLLYYITIIKIQSITITMTKVEYKYIVFTVHVHEALFNIL